MQNRTLQLFAGALCLAVAFIGLSGCQHRAEEPVVVEVVPEPPDRVMEVSEVTTTTGAGLPDIDLSNLQFVESDLEMIFFEFDRSNLVPEARETLQQNAAKIRNSNAIVQIEGHCDNRGTQEYNLALGERRAQSARNYLMQLGIPASRLVTISYGEERPLVVGADTEAEHAMNRRCEFKTAL